MISFLKRLRKKSVLVEIKLLPNAIFPSQPYKTDACWDLYAIEDVEIPPGRTVEVHTGVFMHIPAGFEGELKCRSSWGKKGLSIHHGAIDSGYQGEIYPFVYNFSSETFYIHRGDRVVQFCLREVIPISWIEVNTFTPSARGVKGHGSSGR